MVWGGMIFFSSHQCAEFLDFFGLKVSALVTEQMTGKPIVDKEVFPQSSCDGSGFLVFSCHCHCKFSKMVSEN